jgi:hypothetical protein
MGKHPTWCHRDECTVDDRNTGSHWSRMMVVDADLRVDPGLVVQLTQGLPDQRCPGRDAVLVVVTIRLTQEPHDGEDVVVTLSGGRAKTLGRLLVVAGREASGAPR